jgi:2-methylcitrate dehydratase PrpD
MDVRRNRIAAVGDASLTESVRTWRCAIEITLKDGRTLRHETLKAPGNMGNPLTRKQVEEKALDLMAPVLGRKRSETLMNALFDIDKLKDVCALRRLYAA